MPPVDVLSAEPLCRRETHPTTVLLVAGSIPRTAATVRQTDAAPYSQLIPYAGVYAISEAAPMRPLAHGSFVARTLLIDPSARRQPITYASAPVGGSFLARLRPYHA